MTEPQQNPLARSVPRYTSYPTAPHFHTGIGNADYARWLGELPAATALSLYVHVPFCDRLCWFCGCYTKQVLRYDPIAAYLPSVHREIGKVAELLDGRGYVSALHLGGGSPSMLKPGDLAALIATIRKQYVVSEGLEFSLEIDPNDMTPDRYDGLAAAGVTRISVGVQDFNPEVQAAINRIQTFEQTRGVVEGMRARGVGSVNLDVLYGLPLQTLSMLEATVDQALSMRPDRLALFGYAHVPWMKTHQKMIDEAALPGFEARLEQSAAAASRILAAGYVAIGIDHFALPTDTLAQQAGAGKLHRNFQGYTTDVAPALIGLGASSIGNLPQGYVQNVAATGEYIRRIAEDGLAVARGIALSDDDRMRSYVIERLMCDFTVSLGAVAEQFGGRAAGIAQDMQRAARTDTHGFVSFDGDRFAITPEGRPFARLVAAEFDAYLANGTARHSVAV
jgi:oxygen-independent coproporphyrinogen III oxidase